MPRNKTFRKRNPKKIQKGGAFTINTKIESTNSKKYYAYVVKKTLKTGGVSSSSSSSSSGSSSGSSSSSSSIGGGGGGGGFVVAVTTSPPENEYEYTTTIIDENQKTAICADKGSEKAKIITSASAGAGAGAGAAGNLNQFVEKNTGDEVITIFELNGGNSIELNSLTITKENVKWNDYVAC